VYDYNLAIKNKGCPPKPGRWEIYAAEKSKPVQQSEFFETMSEATRTGKAALAEVRAKRAAGLLLLARLTYADRPPSRLFSTVLQSCFL
jgi:hypothetical protein